MEITIQEEKLKIAYEQLREANPDHELLTLSQIDPVSGHFNFSQIYCNRFTNPRDDFGTFGFVRYSKALEQALKD